MPALDILERQERERLSRMTLKQANDAVNRGLYTVEDIMEANPEVEKLWLTLHDGWTQIGN